MKIKMFNEFVNTVINIDNFIQAKMDEFKDLIDKDTYGQNLIYEWEKNDINHLVITFEYNGDPIKFELNYDEKTNSGELIITNSEMDNIQLKSIEEGLDIIEKRIMKILKINENYIK